MIGTTFKLGFDGTSVQRGLGKLASGMARGFGRIGIGAMERVGHRMTDLMGRLVMAIPETLRETGEWAGGMTDMATATGMSVEKLVLLEEKFRLAGVQAKESGAVMSRFALNLKTAGTEGGAAADALRTLGFKANAFMNVPLDEALEKIAKQINAGIDGGWLKNPEGVMSDLFGQRLGYQQLKLFRDYAAVSEQAANNVGKLAAAMGSGQAANLDRWSDALGRFENLKRSLASIAMDEFFKISGGPGSADSFFDTFDPEKLRPKIAGLMEGVRNALKDPVAFFGDSLRAAGREIGKGITESISVKSFLPSLIKPKTDKDKTEDVAEELKRQTPILKGIMTNSMRATFN